MGKNFDPRELGAQCDKCPLNGCKPVPPKIREISQCLIPAAVGSYPMLFVLDGPSFDDVKQERFIVGAAGTVFYDMLKALNLTRENVSVTSTLLCRIEVPDESGKRRYQHDVYMSWLRKENKRREAAGQLPLESPFDCCRPRLVAEIQNFDREALNNGWPNGAVVLPMNNGALKETMALVGQKPKAGIMRYRGSVIHAGNGD